MPGHHFPISFYGIHIIGLVVWNMISTFFHSVWNFIIPIDSFVFFGWGRLNHQPDTQNIYRISIDYA